MYYVEKSTYHTEKFTYCCRETMHDAVFYRYDAEKAASAADAATNRTVRPTGRRPFAGGADGRR